MLSTRDHTHYVYILTNRRGTLYVGYTGDIVRRVYEHKMKLCEGFSKRYNLDLLVYYEESSDVWAAREREMQIKGWVRRKKVALVEGSNPSWRDLSAGWYDCLG